MGKKLRKLIRIKPCKECGKLFNHRINSKLGRYCSTRCLDKKNYIEIKCLNCQNEFSIRKQLKARRLFCQEKCRIEFKAYANLNKQITKICQICRIEFITSRRFYNQRFCSDICQSIARKELFNQVGIIYLKDKNFRGEDWNIQRNEVLKRDNDMCQLCGEQLNLDVHHIIPYSISRNNELSNLITLCGSCHPREDNFYRQHDIPSPRVRQVMEELTIVEEVLLNELC